MHLYCPGNFSRGCRTDCHLPGPLVPPAFLAHLPASGWQHNEGVTPLSLAVLPGPSVHVPPSGWGVGARGAALYPTSIPMRGCPCVREQQGHLCASQNASGLLVLDLSSG